VPGQETALADGRSHLQNEVDGRRSADRFVPHEEDGQRSAVTSPSERDRRAPAVRIEM
jgi:hypothetical protein